MRPKPLDHQFPAGLSHRQALRLIRAATGLSLPIAATLAKAARKGGASGVASLRSSLGSFTQGSVKALAGAVIQLQDSGILLSHDGDSGSLAQASLVFAKGPRGFITFGLVP